MLVQARAILVCAALTVLVLPDSAAAQAFNVTDLGTLCRNAVACDGTETRALDLNTFGDVAGDINAEPTGPGPQRGFLWTHGPLIDLGTLPGLDGISATGVNNARHVSGYA